MRAYFLFFLTIFTFSFLLKKKNKMHIIYSNHGNFNSMIIMSTEYK